VNAQFSFLTRIETDLVHAESRVHSLSEVSLTAAAQQSALARIGDSTDALFETLAVTTTDSSAVSLESLVDQAHGALDAIMSTLNTSYGGRHLFSGTKVDSPALISAQDMLNDLSTAVTGASSIADVQSIADNFFDLATGGFETGVYIGSDQALTPVDLGNGQTASLNVRADDQVFRKVLKSVALIAIADDTSLAIPDSVRRELAVSQTDALLSASSDITELRAQLGFSEGRIERSITQFETERASLELARGELVNVDPFETASTLEAVRQQLETLYTITARTSRLSLANFL
jgi:flagellar hook-associated protein 3 FlgL